MTIIRVHRKEKDFFVAKNEAMNSTKLSFKAKGLWAYAMSRPDDWTFSVAHLVKVSKDKEKAIYSALRELITAGYAHREQKQGEDGRWNSTDYIIFETLNDAEEFKKCLPLCQKGDAGKGDAQKEGLLSTNPLPSTDKEPITNSQAAALAEEFYFALVDSHGQDFKKPNLNQWSKVFDLMLRKDKVEPSMIRKVMNWAVNDSFWKGNILSANKLREKYLQLKIKMEISCHPNIHKKNKPNLIKADPSAPITPAGSDFVKRLFPGCG